MTSSSAIVLLDTPSQRKPLVVPRVYRGNMCGVRVPGLPAVETGRDPALVVSWIVFKYSPEDRQRIYAAWKAKGYVDVLVSWPDFRDWTSSRNDAESRAAFVAWCAELVDAGFLPTVMFCSKDFDWADEQWILINALPVLKDLIAANVIARACVGWELSLWLSPTQVQILIDAICAVTVPAGIKTYVHFQQGYSTFGQPGEFFADFWNRNVRKLTGVLHQKLLDQSPNRYRFDSGGLFDVLLRFSGGYGVSPDSGFGHPFDLIALEITAAQQWSGTCSEDQGNALGTWAIETPSVLGPFGPVRVMGSGNGQL